jgi:hypothetical protein
VEKGREHPGLPGLQMKLRKEGKKVGERLEEGTLENGWGLSSKPRREELYDPMWDEDGVDDRHDYRDRLQW